MFAYLAVASITMIKPLKEAVLVNKLDAAAAGARITERILSIAGIPADPADILLIIIVIVLARNIIIIDLGTTR
jgi:hypothetical protein